MSVAEVPQLWAPALLWLLVVGVGLLFVPATGAADQRRPDRGGDATQ